jgi:choline dehydrogenase-like flavoprotein
LPYQAVNEDGEWTFELLGFAMRPKSRGIVKLRGTDPTLTPHIDFRFLSDPGGHDLAVLERTLRLMRRLAASPALSNLAEPASDINDAETYIREGVAGYAHAVGTCRMGKPNSESTVAAGSGRVIGTENVWICDASAIPVIPSANTNLSCMLVGWRMAQSVAETMNITPAI